MEVEKKQTNPKTNQLPAAPVLINNFSQDISTSEQNKAQFNWF